MNNVTDENSSLEPEMRRVKQRIVKLHSEFARTLYLSRKIIAASKHRTLVSMGYTHLVRD